MQSSNFRVKQSYAFPASDWLQVEDHEHCKAGTAMRLSNGYAQSATTGLCKSRGGTATSVLASAFPPPFPWNRPQKEVKARRPPYGVTSWKDDGNKPLNKVISSVVALQNTSTNYKLVVRRHYPNQASPSRPCDIFHPPPGQIDVSTTSQRRAKETQVIHYIP